MPFLYRKSDRIYYDFHMIANKNSAETIILVHTNISDHTLFDRIMPTFSEQYNILRYDLRGFGKSDLGSEELTLNLYIEDLNYIIQALKLKSFLLMGLGFGALIALQYAVTYDNLVKKLVLMSMPCNPPHLIERIREHRRNLSLNGTLIPYDYIIRMSNLLPSNHPDNIKLKNSMQGIAVSTYTQIMDLTISAEPLELLKSLWIPTLVLSGEKDVLFPQQFLIANISHLDNFTHTTIPDSSVFMVLDKPYVTGHLILDFIKNSKPTTTQLDPFVTSMSETIRSYVEEVYELGSLSNKQTINVTLLSKFNVYVNGKKISEGWNKRFAKSIFVYLLFHQTVSREQICEALWHELPLDQAKRNLRVYLTYLKKLINTPGGQQPFITTDREHIHLGGTISCDLMDLMVEIRKIADTTNLDQKLDLGLQLFQRLTLDWQPAIFDNWFIEHINQTYDELIDLAIWVADSLIAKDKSPEAIHHLTKCIRLFKGDEQIYQYIIDYYKTAKDTKKVHYWMKRKEALP